MGRPPKKHGLDKEDAPAKRARTNAAAADTKKRPRKTRRATTLNTPPTDVLDVLVFGDGEAGELGLGPTVTSTARPRLNTFLSAASSTTTPATPSTAPAPVDTVQVACGGMHSVVLTRDNKIVTWGVNDHGALGRDTAWEGGLKDINDDSDSGASLNPRESTPTAIPDTAFPSGTRFAQVAAGDSCSFALTDTGLVYGWGTFRTPDGKKFFLPVDEKGTVDGCQLTPVRIPGLQGITQLAVGANHALALEAENKTKKTRVWAWGCGDQQQLGRLLVDRHCPRDKHGNLLVGVRTPLPVVLGNRNSSVAFIAAGEYHSFAVGTSGRVWAWGLNSFGETGAAADEQRRHGADAAANVVTPTEVAALADEGVVALAGGGHHSVALTADGRCLAWGRLDSGQLGVDPDNIVDKERLVTDARGRPRACLLPTEIRLETRPKEVAVAVACGTEHTLVVTSADGHAVFGFGFNGQAQLGLGPVTDEEVAVATRLGGKALQDRRLAWAGAGGQFSMVAGPRRTGK